MIQPYEHQQKSINEILEKFQTNQRVLYQLPTGGGKTFVFSFLTKLWVERTGKKVLILCHREALVNQTISSLNQISLSCEAVISRTKELKHNCNVYVGMIQTINNRLNANENFFKDVDLVICDECHILIFDKVFKFFPFANILGCTATPIVQKKITFFKCQHCKTNYDELTNCCNDEVIEWTRPFTMSEIYNDIVVGATIQDLINDGKLVQEISFVKNYTDNSNLKIDTKSGEYTEESMNAAYNNDDALFNVVLNYKEICEGKKTMIFNSSTKANLLVYQKFIDAGYTNIKMIDSVNDCEPDANVIKWFKDNQSGILCNVGKLTTGFDDTTVEAIIVNRPIASLSLWLQIVGRGGRSTDKIYKDNFIVIDGGGNVDRHNEWSDNTRDWKRIFFEGKEKPKAKKEDIEDLQNCEGCGAMFPKTNDTCPECFLEVIKLPKVEDVKIEDEVITQPIKKIPPPNAEKIYLYTLQNNEDLNFAWRIMINQIFDLFRYYRVSEEKYLSAKASGELDKKIKKMITGCYFILKGKPDLNSGVERTIQYLINKVKIKIEKYYGK
jgi:superfamily II DNA or RNA helicase